MGELVSGIADVRTTSLTALAARASGEELKAALAAAVESTAGQVPVAAFNSSI